MSINDLSVEAKQIYEYARRISASGKRVYITLLCRLHEHRTYSAALCIENLELAGLIVNKGSWVEVIDNRKKIKSC